MSEEQTPKERLCPVCRRYVLSCCCDEIPVAGPKPASRTEAQARADTLRKDLESWFVFEPGDQPSVYYVMRRGAGTVCRCANRADAVLIVALAKECAGLAPDSIIDPHVVISTPGSMR